MDRRTVWKLKTFFSSLYRNCYRDNNINSRFPPDEGNFSIRLSEISETEEIEMPRILLDHKDKDAYFRIATGGTIQIPALWVSLGLENKDALIGFRNNPTVTVNTGDGYNVYWRLRTPATKDQVRDKDSILKRIASHLRGDMEMADAFSFLRIPCTWNSKCNKPVTIEGIIRPNSEYDLKDFDFLN